MAVYLKRNTNIYISKADQASANATNTVQLNVKDFSFNQVSRVDKVGRDTLDPTQERTLRPHIAALAPVNFTFTTYVLPVEESLVTSPEEYLWVSLMGTDNVTSSSTESIIDFSDGNVATLAELTLWFDHPNQAEGNYRLDNAIVDSATVKFDINGIAEVEWSGRALSITQDNTPPTATDRTTIFNYIKNRLSTITLNMNAVNYTLALTGGEFRIDNRVQFYGRSKMGETTVPVGHFTGNREISGNLQFYMRSGTNESVDLFNTILTNASAQAYEAVYEAAINVYIGGATKNPRLKLTVPQALLEIGQQNFDEVISVRIPFTAKEEAGNYCSITYVI